MDFQLCFIWIENNQLCKKYNINICRKINIIKENRRFLQNDRNRLFILRKANYAKCLEKNLKEFIMVIIKGLSMKGEKINEENK